jgi:hypothetical protein
MKYNEYNDQMQRLVKVYGVPKYPTERIEMIFDVMKFLEIEAFKKQVSYFIGAMEKPPMMADFIEAFRSVLGDARKLENEAKELLLGACMNCNGTGHTTMYEKMSGFEFAFQCTCARGEMYQSSFPKQYPNMGDDYASHRAYVSGRFDRIGAMKRESIE